MDILTLLSIFFSKKAYVSSKDRNGDTPLHYAAENGHFSMVQLLINNGAKVNIQDTNFCILLYI